MKVGGVAQPLKPYRVLPLALKRAETMRYWR